MPIGLFKTVLSFIHWFISEKERYRQRKRFALSPNFLAILPPHGTQTQMLKESELAALAKAVPAESW